MKSIYAVILAAGKGKRMKTHLPKVLHIVGGKTMVEHAALLAQKIKPTKSIFVVPKDYHRIQDALFSNGISTKKSGFVIQAQQLGTGHALKRALAKIPAKSGLVVVVNGDMPLIKPSSLRRLIDLRKRGKAPIALLSADISNTHGLGRIIRDQNGLVINIMEEMDASTQQKRISEINVGVYVFDLAFVRKYIGKIKNQNKQKEYYLPDLVRLAVKAGLPVIADKLNDPLEALGINSQKDLNIVNQIFYQMQKEKFMKEGVTLVGDEIFIEASVKLASGVTLESPCYLKGNSKIHKNVTIEMGCIIKSSDIGAETLIKAHSYIDKTKIADHCQVGPFAHLRPGTRLLTKAKVGNFVEIKKSRIGEGSKANHLSYIGDAELGKKVNVGAGTITCNYDGFKKSKTILEDRVFIGSDTQLIAPVRVGKGAVIGAGTTVTENVGADNLVLSRVPQQEIPGWAKKNRQKNS